MPSMLKIHKVHVARDIVVKAVAIDCTDIVKNDISKDYIVLINDPCIDPEI